MTDRHCVVLAGGLGTRIREVTNGLIPKVLVPVLGRPFLQYKLESLRDMGVTHATVLVGELGWMVDEFLETSPVSGIVCTSIHDGPKLLGTAGAIARACSQLPEMFWVTYGDSYVIADLRAAEDTAAARGLKAIMTLLHNFDSLETSNTSVSDGLVSNYRKGAEPGTFEWIDYGLLRFAKDAFTSLPKKSPTDLYQVLKGLISRREVLSFEATDRFWDVGTPAALKATESEFRRRDILR